jgi:hypothetical protein
MVYQIIGDSMSSIPRIALPGNTAHSTELDLIRQYNAVLIEIKPTTPLPENAQTIFDGIIASREIDSWMPNDVRLATQLARTIQKLEEIMTRTENEDPVLFSTRGTPVQNPVYSIMMQLSTTVQSLTRTLGLSAGMRELSTARSVENREKEAKIRAAQEKSIEHDLL